MSTVGSIGSEAWCRQAYLNYHCYGNSMGITAAQMGEIVTTWKDKISSWQNSVANDETEYEFDDSDYAAYIQEGKEKGEEVAGGDEGEVQESSKTIVPVVAGALMLIPKAMDILALCKGARGVKPVAWFASAAEVALAAAYWAMRPNEEAQEACTALETEMEAAQQLLLSTQEEMGCYGDEIIELSDLAFTYNEETNEELKEKQAEYEMYLEAFTTIQAKIEAGEELTPEEKEFYQKLVGLLQEIGVQIEGLTADTTDEVGDLYEEIGAYQDGFDTAAETMGEIEGLTDFAESFDKDAQTQAYVLGSVLSLNSAASGTIATFLFADGNPFTKLVSAVFACAAAGAAVSNGVAAQEQFRWAGDIGEEIGAREGVQSTNTETMDVYEEQIDYFAGYMEGVEDLELEVPDGIVPPEGSDAPTGGDGDSPGVPTGGSDGEDPDKKPKTPPAEE